MQPLDQNIMLFGRERYNVPLSPGTPTPQKNKQHACPASAHL